MRLRRDRPSCTRGRPRPVPGRRRPGLRTRHLLAAAALTLAISGAGPHSSKAWLSREAASSPARDGGATGTAHRLRPRVARFDEFTEAGTFKFVASLARRTSGSQHHAPRRRARRSLRGQADAPRAGPRSTAECLAARRRSLQLLRSCRPCGAPVGRPLDAPTVNLQASRTSNGQPPAYRGRSGSER